LKKVDLLLADIQGAELAMLAGARRAIERGQIRFLLVSTHHHRISGDPVIHQKCLRFVREHGGHILAEHGIGESFSGDGLIAASFDPADRTLPAIHLSRNRTAEALFPEVEFDLDEAWQAISMAAQMLSKQAGQNEVLAKALVELENRLGPSGWRLPIA
jgi:hypothetical protein